MLLGLLFLGQGILIFHFHEEVLIGILFTIDWFLTGVEFAIGLTGFQSPVVNYVNDFFKSYSYSQISFSDTLKIIDRTYVYGGWFLPSLFVILGLKLLTVKEKYVTTHTFESLLEQETHLWRFNRYLVKNNPFDDSDDVTKGKFRMAELPYSFLKSRNLIISSVGAPDEIHVKRAKGVFVKQLGTLITGLESFSKHERMILAVFMSVLYKERDFSNLSKVRAVALNSYLGRNNALDKVSGDISFMLNKEMKPSKVNAMVSDLVEFCWEGNYVQELLHKHAYTQTFLRGMYIDVKRSGSFPPSYIGWIKMLDRNLFYTLETTGVPGVGSDFNKKENQPGGCIEAAMTIRHYTSERVSGTAIPQPEFDLLAADLNEYLTRRYEAHNRDW